MINPVAKRDSVYLEKVADEVILYDKVSHKAHCLNSTMAAVWQHADGSRSVDDLAQILEAGLGIPHDRNVVLLSLQQLETAGLMQIEPEPQANANMDRPSRRQIGRRLAQAGLSASLMPVIASVMAPTPAMAGSPGRGITSQKYQADLKIIQTDIGKDWQPFSNSKVAQTDFFAGVNAGNQGTIQQLQGNQQGAQATFQVAENDFDGVLKALGLPPL
jgi:hypothetical protein